MQLPDAVVGIGGVGKQVVHEALTTDWLLRAGLADGGDDLFDAVTVDTAGDERDHDRMRVADDTDHVQAVADRFGAHPAAVDDPTHVHLPDAAGEYGTPAALRREEVGRAILDATPLSTWWPSVDGTAPELDGFADGTVRRRALGRALLYAADASGGLDPLHTALAGADDVVVVAGLGGGTGAGVALDLARLVDGHGRISLLGVLPEEERVGLANAHATLSELEYCWLTDRSPFDAVVLLPPPADEPECSRAAVHTLVGYANATSRQFTPGTPTGPPAHAPFTVTVPRVAEFDVPEIREARGRLERTLAERRDALDIELALYDELDALLSDLFDAFETRVDAPELLVDEAEPGHVEALFGSLDDEAVARLAGRVERLQSALESEALGLLDVPVADAWHEAFEQLEHEVHAQGAAPDSPERRRAKLREVYETPLAGLVPVDVDDELSAEMTDCIETELRAIRARTRLLAAASAFSEPGLSELLQAVLDSDRRYSREADRFGDETLARLDRLHERAERLDAVRAAVTETTEDLAHEWVVTTESEVAWLVAFEDHRSRIESLLDELERALTEFAAVVSEYDPGEHPDPAPDLTVVDAINDRLQTLGLRGIDETRIRTSVEGVRRAWQVAAEAEGGILPQFIRRRDYEAEYAAAANQVDPTLFALSGVDEPSQCEYVGDLRADVLDRLDGHREDRIEELCDVFEALVVDADVPERVEPSVPEDVGAAWPGDAAPVDGATIARLVAQAAGDEAATRGALRERAETHLTARWLDPLDEMRDRHAAEVDAAERRGDLLDALLDECESLGAEFADRSGEPWRELVAEDLAPGDTELAARIHPQQPELLLDAGTLAEAMPADADLDALRFGLADAVHGGELPIEAQDGPLAAHHRAETVYASEGSGPNGPLDGMGAVDEAVRDLLGPATGFTTQQVGAGLPWGVSAVTFVGGVALDNLAPVVDQGGYLDSYEAVRDARDGSVCWRHAHGLGGRDTRFVTDADGMYLVRESLRAGDDGVDAERLLEQHYRFTPFRRDVTVDTERRESR